MAGGCQRSSRAEALCRAESCFWKAGVQLKSHPGQCDEWEACAVKSEEKLQLASRGTEWALWGVIYKKKNKNKRTRRKSLGVKNPHCPLQLPDHRVCTQSCFYVHHQYCFLGGSSNKGHPKLLSAFMEMLPPFWGDTLKNLNSLWGNKKTSRLTDIRQGRY